MQAPTDPVDATNRVAAFLSLPFTINLGEDGMFLPDRRAFYKEIVEALVAENCLVYSPVTNEDWGRVKLSVRDFTLFDLNSIRNARALVVVASEPVGRDIYLEIGIALGKNIPVGVFVAASQRSRFTFMLEGLCELGSIYVDTYEREEDAPDKVRTFIQAVVRRNGFSR